MIKHGVEFASAQVTLKVLALVPICRFLYTLFYAFPGPPLAFVRGVVVL